MALVNTEATNQVLEDGSKLTLTKHVYYANAATDESDVLKVNAAALCSRVFVYTLANNSYSFVPGEPLTGNTSGAVGYVVTWLPSANALAVVFANTTLFTASEPVKFSRLQSNEFTCPETYTSPQLRLGITSIWHDIAPGVTVELAWQGAYANSAAAHERIAVLNDTNYFGENALGSVLSNPIGQGGDTRTTTGNLLISTKGMAAGKGYTIVLELRKVEGYIARPTY